MKCFDQLATAPPWDGAELVRNCSSTFLPNITDHCSTDLEEDTSFGMFWIRTKDCFNDYVKENYFDGDVETDVLEWLTNNHDEDKFDWSDFIIGSSCALESLLVDGEYDQKTANACEKCFGQLKEASILDDGLTIVRNCSNIYLPSISDQCTAYLEQDASFAL
jgi:hypothetical protein